MPLNWIVGGMKFVIEEPGSAARIVKADWKTVDAFRPDRE